MTTPAITRSQIRQILASAVDDRDDGIERLCMVALRKDDAPEVIEARRVLISFDRDDYDHEAFAAGFRAALDWHRDARRYSESVAQAIEIDFDRWTAAHPDFGDDP